jgi:hypothetical protein
MGMYNEEMPGLRMAGKKLKEYGNSRRESKRMNQGGPGMAMYTGYGNEQESGRGATKVAPYDGFHNMLLTEGGENRMGM